MRRLKLILILCVAVGVFALAAACGQYDPVDALDKEGYTLEIAYDLTASDATEANYPTFNNKKDFTLVHRYQLQEGQNSTFIAQPGTGALGDVSRPVYSGHFLEGWYRDKAFTQKWDYAQDRASESMTLFARWYRNFAFEIKYVENDIEGVADTIDVLEGGVLSPLSPPKRAAHTMLALWQDRACTIPYDYSTVHAGTITDGVQSDRVQTVWSTWIKGNYKLIRAAKDLKNFKAGENYYLMNNIDFTGETWNAAYEEYYGTFMGNGYTVSNVTFEADYSKTSSRRGLFGSLTKKADADGKPKAATFKDVEFTNITMKFEYNGDFACTIGLFAGAIDEGVTFDNVKLSGVIDASELTKIPTRNFFTGKVAGYLGVGQDGVVEGLTADVAVLTNPAIFTVQTTNANDFKFVKVV